MTETPPTVYLLHGDDEFAVAQFIHQMTELMGDPSMAEMNTTRFDGPAPDLEELSAAASAVPFLTKRRLVILSNPTSKLTGSNQRERFIKILEVLPPTTALVLVERKVLQEANWLLKWAMAAGERAFVRAFSVPKGGALANWIRERAKREGGEFSTQAAALLAEMAGDDLRLADNEISKLLAYVNHARPVDVDDVENLAAFASGKGDYFRFIDTLGAGNGRAALDMLRRLLDQQEPLQLFFGLINHFRLLLLAREIMDGGEGEAAVAKKLGIHPYRAKKLTQQARPLKMVTLEAIYRRLLELDEEIKTGQMEAGLALDTLVAALTQQPA